MKFSSHRFSIAANTYSNHAILAKLRKRLLPELEGWFVPMLTLTQGMKWERLGYIALDSSTIKPHALKHKALSSGYLEQIKVQLCEEAQTLLVRAEVTDRKAWSDEIDRPEERAWREERLRVLVDAKAPLEAEVEARYKEQQRAYGTMLGSSKQAGGFSRNGFFHWLSEVGWIAYSRANLETIFNSFGVSSATLALSLALGGLRCLDIVIISATRGCSQLQPSPNHLSSFQDPRYFLEAYVSLMNTTLRPLYFDTAASTQVAPEVLAKMVEVLSSNNGVANPSSTTHLPGQTAATIIDKARTEIALELGCEIDEVVFTSGATEANNLALRGVALAHPIHGCHLVTSEIEHKAVLECCAALEREGYEVTYLSPNSKGWIEPESIERALRPDTLLVSLMHTNNETGVMQPITEVAALALEHGVLLHVDAAQAAGKFRINLGEIPIDLLSLSAHKFHGPKGIGCLVVRNRRRLRLRPLLYGGGQEFGLRPGTLPTHQIVGLSTALNLAAERREADLVRVTELKHRFLAELKARLPVRVHGQLENTSPYIVNFSIAGIRGDALINQLADEVAIASGSACSSGTVDPSYVLRAMGIEGDALYGAVRLSFDRHHSEQDITTAVEQIVAAVRRMQELAF